MAGPKDKSKKTKAFIHKTDKGDTYTQTETPARRITTLTHSKSGPQSGKTSVATYDKRTKKGNIDTFTTRDVKPNKSETTYQLGERSNYRKGTVSGSTQRKSGAAYSGSEKYKI
jgi:hypothetical protein